jgi:hypothetical protein
VAKLVQEDACEYQQNKKHLQHRRWALCNKQKPDEKSEEACVYPNRDRSDASDIDTPDAVTLIHSLSLSKSLRRGVSDAVGQHTSKDQSAATIVLLNRVARGVF